MAISRREAVDILVRVGLPDLVAEARAELPDPVEMADLYRFGQCHGISKDVLMSRMGGSP
jgi:hypothetical protein